jgi:hypothetical protein
MELSTLLESNLNMSAPSKDSLMGLKSHQLLGFLI